MPNWLPKLGARCRLTRLLAASSAFEWLLRLLHRLWLLLAGWRGTALDSVIFPYRKLPTLLTTRLIFTEIRVLRPLSLGNGTLSPCSTPTCRICLIRCDEAALSRLPLMAHQARITPALLARPRDGHPSAICQAPPCRQRLASNEVGRSPKISAPTHCASPPGGRRFQPAASDALRCDMALACLTTADEGLHRQGRC